MMLLHWIKAKKPASVQAKLLIGHGKQKNTFAEASDREIKTLVDNSAQREKKFHKIYRNDICAFA